jgi:phenylpyruvate tautomerase PptA (4-oxalocrotonate tautomerase family)
MSTIIVKSKRDLLPNIKHELAESLVQVTSQLLNKKPSEVIVEFEIVSKESMNVPDILFRCETSPFRRNLIKEWGEKVLVCWKTLSEKHRLEPGIHAAVKSYVIDSEWTES